jgi:hypothetical protein
MFQYIVKVRFICNDFLFVGIHDNFSRIDNLLEFAGSHLFDNFDNITRQIIHTIQVQDAIFSLTVCNGKSVEYSVFCMVGKGNLKRTAAEISVIFVATDTFFIRNCEEKGRISIAEFDTIRSPSFPDAPYVVT